VAGKRANARCHWEFPARTPAGLYIRGWLAISSKTTAIGAASLYGRALETAGGVGAFDIKHL